jgi:hypothetical protein
VKKLKGSASRSYPIALVKWLFHIPDIAKIKTDEVTTEYIDVVFAHELIFQQGPIMCPYPAIA